MKRTDLMKSTTPGVYLLALLLAIPKAAGAQSAEADPATQSSPEATPSAEIGAPTPAIAATTVPVHFVADSGKNFTVKVIGATRGECQVPCTLELSPGTATIKVSGDANYEHPFEIPRSGATVELETQNRGLLFTGLVLVIVGGGLSATAGALAAGKDTDEISPGEAGRNLGLAVSGLVSLVTGFVLMFSSGKNRASVTDVTSLSRGPWIGFSPSADGVQTVQAGVSWTF